MDLPERIFLSDGLSDKPNDNNGEYSLHPSLCSKLAWDRTEIKDENYSNIGIEVDFMGNMPKAFFDTEKIGLL